MAKINAGQLVTVVTNPYIGVKVVHGYAYAVKAVHEQVGQQPVVDVVVPNDYDEDVIPFYENEVRLVLASEL
jgi:hypothetical protein